MNEFTDVDGTVNLVSCFLSFWLKRSFRPIFYFPLEWKLCFVNIFEGELSHIFTACQFKYTKYISAWINIYISMESLKYFSLSFIGYSTMEIDCNLKYCPRFNSKFFLCVLIKSLKAHYVFVVLPSRYFLLNVVRALFRLKEGQKFASLHSFNKKIIKFTWQWNY